MGNGLTIGRLLEENTERLGLTLHAGENGLDNVVISPEMNRPGLALTGFVDLFTFNRIQLIGNTEMLYLSMLPKKERISSIDVICQFDLPCIIFTNNIMPPKDMADICNANHIPLIVTTLSTTQFVHLFSYYLEDFFAHSADLHGTLVDVYGMGLLFTGRAGIGKSEVTLDLVERGHRLVADDIVHVVRKSRGVIIGSGRELMRTKLEIRGVGIVDVQQMFGIRAVRTQKRIEIEVELVDWDDSIKIDRSGLNEEIRTILDADVPLIKVPIYPGKYIAVIVESIALNHLLKLRGYNASHEVQENLLKQMALKAKRL